jgi:heat-inducible transcriptional repressor
MRRGLAHRQEQVLKMVVREYIARASPVASEALARDYKLEVSPATVRNYLAHLEEEGYISRPHTSAGSVPTPKAYRYYVQSLAQDIQPSPEEQRFISAVFDDKDGQYEEWARLAAVLLARLVRNVALVTVPRAPQTRLRNIQLVHINARVALLVAVLSDFSLRQQMLQFTENLTAEDLQIMANRLNENAAGLTVPEIRQKKLNFSVRDHSVLEAVLNLVAGEDETQAKRPYLEGMRLLLNQPEFLPSDRMLDLMEFMENPDWLRRLFHQAGPEGDVKVIIGDESGQSVMHDLSLVYSQYGLPSALTGNIGVLGPTRMDYGRTIAAVRYLSHLLTGMFEGFYESPEKGSKL